MKYWKKTLYWLSNQIKAIQNTGLRSQKIGAAIFFLGVSFVFTACEKKDILGLEVQPDSERLGTHFTDTLSVNAYTVNEDSIPTDETALNLVGNYTDPVFGYTEASTYMSFRLSEEVFDFSTVGNNLVADSVVLSLVYSTFYGKLTPADFIVNEVTEAMHKDSTYYSNQTFSFDNNPLGQKIGVVPNLIDSVIVAGEREPAQLRIKLSKQFAIDLLNAGTGVYASNDAFESYLKGVIVRPGDCIFGGGPGKGCNEHRNPGEGGIYYFNLLSGFSRLTLYYHSDTANHEYEYYINSNSTRVNSFKQEHEGTVIESAIADQTSGQQLLYVQAMGGAKAKVEFPSLETFAKQGPIGVSLAEVEVNVQADSDDTYPANPQLFLIGINEEGTSVFLPDQFEDADYYGGDYDLNTGQYTFRINRYIQQVLTAYQQGDNKNFGLYLVSGSASISANRAIIEGTASNAGRLKLNLSYTPL